jgi:hypothetical protein
MSAGLPALPSLTAIPPAIPGLIDDVFPNILSFLQPEDVARFERVCRAWKLHISSAEMAVWKDQCAVQKNQPLNSAPTTVLALSILRPNVRASDIFENFDDDTLTLISDYAFEENFDHNNFPSKVLDIISQYAEPSPENYKAPACWIKGNIYLEPSYHYINTKKKTGVYNSLLRWGTDAPEPFVFAKVSSDESMAACRVCHVPRCMSMSSQGTWVDIHPRLHRSPRFPSEFPLRLFMNQNGSFKKDGDKIRIQFQNRHIVLTCELISWDRPDHGRPFTTLAEAIQHRINVSIASRFMRTQDVDQAKASAATTIQGEWISTD